MHGLWFIDFEASSLGDQSYPIEVGLAYLDLESGTVTSEGYLISPTATWTDWNPESEKIHGIARSQLAVGFDPPVVAALLNQRLAGQSVFCDSPRFDGHWANRLFQAAGQKPLFHLDHIWSVLADIPDPNCSIKTMVEWRSQVQVMLGEQNPHRAEADARLLADVYLRAKALWVSLSQA